MRPWERWDLGMRRALHIWQIFHLELNQSYQCFYQPASLLIINNASFEERNIIRSHVTNVFPFVIWVSLTEYGSPPRWTCVWWARHSRGRDQFSGRERARTHHEGFFRPPQWKKEDIRTRSSWPQVASLRVLRLHPFPNHWPSTLRRSIQVP